MVKVNHKSKKAGSLLITFIICSALAGLALVTVIVITSYQYSVADRMEELRTLVFDVYKWSNVWKLY